MTYVQYINCDKWKEVIAIALWVSVTISLGVGLYIGYQGITHLLIVPPLPFEGNFTQSLQDYTVQLKAHFNAQDTNDNNFTIFVFSLIGNMVNIPTIWYWLNRHYRWIELRCGVKPKTEQVK